MKLKYKEQKFRIIGYHDWEKFVTKAYKLKREYNVVTDEEWSNDSTHTITAEVEELDEFEQADIDEFLSKGKQYAIHTIAKDLCNKGLLEPGEYMIEVCW